MDDSGKDSDPGGGFDDRMNLDNSSDPIETISDDDFYNDSRRTVDNNNNNFAAVYDPDVDYFDDIEPFTDDEDNDNSSHLNRPITRPKFKPFKALAGLENWRPHSPKSLDTTTRYANTNNTTNNDCDNDSIEEGYSDMDLDTTKTGSFLVNVNDNSLDSIRSASSSLSLSPSPSPPPLAPSSLPSVSASPLPPAPSVSPSPAPAPSRPDSISKAPRTHPIFSSYQAKTQDTQRNSRNIKTPAFILDHISNNTNNKSQLSIKKDGLASMALDCINHELDKFQEWQLSVLSEMAKYGSVTKVCTQDPQGRLCRILEIWVENGMVFSWCVDLTIEERQQLLATTGHILSQQQEYHRDDDNIQQDNDIGVSLSQPPPSLPTYEPNNDDRPYVCVFATTYLKTPHKNIISKLLVAEYIAIWPPWTTIPISDDGADMHVHIVTRFMMDGSPT